MGGHQWEPKVRGVTMYGLSPYEQRPFAGMLQKGFYNVFRRIVRNIPFIWPPAITSGLVYYTVEKKHKQLQRKNPEDYVNDV